MGQQSGNQDRLFYSLDLESFVPPNHLLRGIDQCLDLGGLRQHLSDHYSHTGRPSIDPDNDQNADRRLLLWHSF
jgi:transposase